MNSSEDNAAPLAQWLAMPMDPAAQSAIERIRRADDVAHVAVMPDVHAAGDVCVGTAMATNRLIYPSAVGGDIGCGMLAMALGASADVLRDAGNAGLLLRSLGQRIPWQRHHRAAALPFPEDLRPADLSHASLQSVAAAEGRLQLGTLGGGNHFIEFQADESGQLWLMIHSGSRIIGQEVKRQHCARTILHSGNLPALDADQDEGQAYLHDQQWARQFAHANRLAMAGELIAILHSLFKIQPIESATIACDHNHVQREEHFGREFWVHRKGAMPAGAGVAGVVPGSMGTNSAHVEGRGCAQSLCSSAHGAGRLFSRSAARQRFNRADLKRQMEQVWFDPRLSEQLREESPRSYKDINSVLRAQRELVKITRILRPLLVYKGR